MWTLVVAGHLYLLNGQPVRTPDQRACLEFATRLHGKCVQEEREESNSHEPDRNEGERERWVPPEVTPGMLVPEPVRRHDER